MSGHVLYKTGDQDAPDVIKDRDGAIALDMCRKCGKAEIDLVDNPNCELGEDVAKAKAKMIAPIIDRIKSAVHNQCPTLQIGGTLDQELKRTAEMMVELSAEQGVYFAVALLYDSSYDSERIRKLLPFLEKEPGAIKKKELDG